MMRSSAWSASAIEVSCPSGPTLCSGCRCRATEEEEVEEVVLHQVGAHAAGLTVPLAGMLSADVQPVLRESNRSA